MYQKVSRKVSGEDSCGRAVGRVSFPREKLVSGVTEALAWSSAVEDKRVAGLCQPALHGCYVRGG